MKSRLVRIALFTAAAVVALSVCLMAYMWIGEMMQPPGDYQVVSTESCTDRDHLPEMRDQIYGRHREIRIMAGWKSEDCKISMTDLAPAALEHLLGHLQVVPPVKGEWVRGAGEGSVYFRPDKRAEGWKYGTKYEIRMDEELVFRKESNFRQLRMALKPFAFEFKLPPPRIWAVRVSEDMPVPGSGTYTGKFRLRSSYALKPGALESNLLVKGPRLGHTRVHGETIEIEGLGTESGWALELMSGDVFADGIPFEPKAIALEVVGAKDFAELKERSLARLFRELVTIKSCDPATEVEGQGPVCETSTGDESSFSAFEAAWKQKAATGYSFTLVSSLGTENVVTVPAAGALRGPASESEAAQPPTFTIENAFEQMRTGALDPVQPRGSTLYVDKASGDPFRFDPPGADRDLALRVHFRSFTR